LLKVVFKMSWRDFSDNGAKRRRTETSPPTLRPITPAGAKLGDWMKDIEDKINKLKAFGRYVMLSFCTTKSSEESKSIMSKS